MKITGLILLLIVYPCLIGAFMSRTPLQPWVYCLLLLGGVLGLLLLFWNL